eukprot:4680688-Prymnesium_polylepis.1
MFLGVWAQTHRNRSVITTLHTIFTGLKCREWRDDGDARHGHGGLSGYRPTIGHCGALHDGIRILDGLTPWWWWWRRWWWSGGGVGR